MRILPFALTAVAFLYPVAAQAQVVVSRAEIAERVEAGVECYIHPNGPGCGPASDSRPDCDLYWASSPGSSDRAKISRKNQTVVNARVHLKCEVDNFRDPDVYIDIDLGFSCFWRSPSVKVAPADVSIDVDWPWWLDVSTGSVTWWVGNIKSRVQTAKFRASGAVQDFVDEEMVPLSYCPGIAVQNDGSVAIDLAQGTECSAGQTKHRGCPANHHGPGQDFLCVGGRWEMSGGQCEPSAPPGGQPP